MRECFVSRRAARSTGQGRQSDRFLFSEHRIILANCISQLGRSLAIIVIPDDDGLGEIDRLPMGELLAEMAELPP